MEKLSTTTLLNYGIVKVIACFMLFQFILSVTFILSIYTSIYTIYIYNMQFWSKWFIVFQKIVCLQMCDIKTSDT